VVAHKVEVEDGAEEDEDEKYAERGGTRHCSKSTASAAAATAREQGRMGRFQGPKTPSVAASTATATQFTAPVATTIAPS
jgi:hypothetical protein